VVPAVKPVVVLPLSSVTSVYSLSAVILKILIAEVSSDPSEFVL